MNQEAMLFLAKGKLEESSDQNLGADVYRVMFAVMYVVDYENWFQINKAAMAETIGMTRQQFGRALRKLESIGFVLTGPKLGRVTTYRLNPSFGWKGSAKNHLGALKETSKARMAERGLSVVEGGALS